MKKLFTVLGIVLLALVVLAGLGVGVLTLMEYRPADVEAVAPQGKTDRAFADGETLTLVSWNVGYGSLGDNADFFMDGGSSVYTADTQRTQSNLAGIAARLAELNPDIILLQEVDADSARSHGIDERAALADTLAGQTGVARMSAFANNFKAFVPYPLPPIGKVDSGLLTLSAGAMGESARIALPVPFKWPIRTVNLKRCLLVTRYPLDGGDRELVVVNLHLEAYDDGEGKAAQTEQLASFLKAEAEKGNYVIAGGDFNQVFSNVDTAAYPDFTGEWKPGRIEAEAFEGFQLLMDNRVPTCRSLRTPYAGVSHEAFQYYMIDGFIVSANLKVEALETLQTDFVFSDHNPVLLRVTMVQ